MNTALINQALEGDRRAIGRAISALENSGEAAYAIRKAMASRQGKAHVIDVAALRAQSQETDGDIAAMAAMLAAGRGAQSQGIEAES